MIVLLMSTPIRAEASRSIAVVRIALPVRVRAMKSWSTAIRISAAATTKRFKIGTRLSPTMNDQLIGMIWGTLTIVGPKAN